MQYKARIPVRLNLRLATLFAALQGYTYFLAPLLIQQHTAWAVTLTLNILATTSYWSLSHETFHGSFHFSRQYNEVTGRLLCILFGAPYHMLRFGHLMHHRYNRSRLDRSEVTSTTAGVIGQTAYYFRLLQGLYLSELASNLLIMLPRRYLVKLFDRVVVECPEKDSLRRAFLQQLLADRPLLLCRLDSLLTVGLLAAAFCLYGAQWYLLLIMLMARGLIISFADNAYHYGSGLADRKHAYNLALSPWLSKTILHFNLHRVHHRYPGAPWSALPDLFEATQDCLDGGYWSGSLKQLGGTRIITSTTGKENDPPQRVI